ncbi:MAG TPA: NAD-dependent epimerase/dehydratase family protein [Streptosporangiaceae bacterium]|nr:NAD-dependent epimerase/dehydratase family protein [Streptosporangiaceae bacterium]
MRVFVTGASGHLGSAIVPELIAAGHDVVGLARSDAAAATVAARGATVRRGDLDDLDGIKEAAVEADGVIHLAFKHDQLLSGGYGAAVTADLAVVRALGDALAGTGKPLVGTSGTLTLAHLGRLGMEDDAGAPGGRTGAENAVIGFAARDVRSSVVRVPPITHSTLDRHGFARTLIAIARQTGVAGYPGDGRTDGPLGTRWTSVISTGLRLRTRQQARVGTQSGMKESACARSLRASATTSASRP